MIEDLQRGIILTKDEFSSKQLKNGGDRIKESALYVLRTDDSARVRNGYNRLSTRGHARSRET
jgi:hypothetical protein